MRKLASLLLIFSAGCSSTANFKSKNPLSDGVRDKAWSAAPTFVDSAIYATSGLSSDTLVNSFAGTASDTNFELVATLFDPATSVFKAYGDMYSDGSGWAAGGPAIIASAAPSQLGHLGLGVAPGGLFLGGFFQTAASTLMTSTYGLSWDTAQTTALPAGAFPPFSGTDNLTSGPRVAIAYDGLGRAAIFFPDNAGLVQMVTAASATAGTSAPTQVSAAPLQADSAISAAYDGTRYICAGFETSGGTLSVRCADATGGFALGAPQTVAASGAYGHALGTDRAGNLLLVYYGPDSNSVFHAYAAIIAGGVVGAPFVIDAGMDAGFYGLGNATAGARPGIAYLGGGAFLAAWVGINPSALLTQLYSATLLTDGTVGTISSPPYTGDSYGSRPHPLGLHVFGNGNKNAGFALSTITSEGSSPSQDTVQTMVARFQQDDGWLPRVLFGNGCVSTSCRHRPSGGVMSSGDSVVVFVDQDTAGNLRLAGVEFK